MTAIKSKVRDSNMELLRIVAMILVMVVHANFRAMHFPTGYDLAISPSSVFLRYFTESLSIICVNVFVLLSGWYGIHFKISRLLEFIFQVMFFSIVIFALFFILAKPDMSIVEALKKVFLLRTMGLLVCEGLLGPLSVFSYSKCFCRESRAQGIRAFLADVLRFRGDFRLAI
jgi:surface polysaccharide O-acyltransferase-like enzyme